MFLAQTIEVPVHLALYAIAGIAIFIMGLAAARSLFYTPVGYPPIGGGYAPSGIGCGGIIVIALFIAAAVAIYMTFPDAFNFLSSSVESDHTIMQASLPGDDSETNDDLAVVEKSAPDIFEPVDTYHDLASFGEHEKASHEEVVAIHRVQQAASSNERWAESRAAKLRKQGYQNVVVEYRADGTDHPWKILTEAP